MSTGSAERGLWAAYEPLHAIVYFDPSVSGSLAADGLHGFWNGYFAGRAAPLGPVEPAPVTALFFGFAPDMVAKALPKVWSRVSAERAVENRLEAVERALAPLVDQGSQDDLRRVADLLVGLAQSLSYDGRALAAAWAGVAVPTTVPSRLWWAATALREHRGDGHVLAATHAGLSGLEASMTHVAAGPLTRATLQPNRGWDDTAWDAAAASLVERGLLSTDGTLTVAGRTLRQEIEDATDRLAGAAARLEPHDLSLVRDVLGGITRAIVAAGSLPTLNPMGVPVPEAP